MKLAARIAVSLVAVAAVAGCAHSPSTAAIVGDKVISEAEVTEIVDSCRKINPQIKRLDVLFPLMFGGSLDEISVKFGKPIDPARLRAVIEADAVVSQAIGTPCQKVIENDLKKQYLQSVIGQKALFRELPRAQVNPRYGTWDPEQGIDPMGGSMSVEAES
mgnify:CR=1 FL=1